MHKFGVRLVKEDSLEYEVNTDSIDTPGDAQRIFTEALELHLRAEEVFAMLTLNAQNRVIGIFEVSIGSLDKSIVTPREVYKRAILQNARAVICAHNHPSGKTEPSDNDISVTDKLVEAGEILGVEFYDHLIIADEDEYTSLREENHI